MSKFRGIIKPEEGEDLSKLKSVVVKLDDHLRTTNEKLAQQRKLIRTESNTKTREIYLNKSYSMVLEQQSIQRILDSFRKKLADLETETNNSQQSNGKLVQVPAKNTKLLELFKTNDVEPLGKQTKPEHNKESKTGTPANYKKKRKIAENRINSITDLKEGDEKKSKVIPDENMTIEEDKKSTTAVTIRLQVGENGFTDVLKQKPAVKVPDDYTPNQVVIENQDEALQHLKALQEFAMMNDNYRAIGLLIEAEKSFRNPPNNKDFELE